MRPSFRNIRNFRWTIGVFCLAISISDIAKYYNKSTSNVLPKQQRLPSTTIWKSSTRMDSMSMRMLILDFLTSRTSFIMIKLYWILIWCIFLHMLCSQLYDNPPIDNALYVAKTNSFCNFDVSVSVLRWLGWIGRLLESHSSSTDCCEDYLLLYYQSNIVGNVGHLQICRLQWVCCNAIRRFRSLFVAIELIYSLILTKLCSKISLNKSDFLAIVKDPMTILPGAHFINIHQRHYGHGVPKTT